MRKNKLLLAVGLFLLTTCYAQEDITITTYYPSPSGSYRELTTTNNTYLATEGGNVGIGTTTPAVKLEVVGDAGLLNIANFLNRTNNADTSIYIGKSLSAGRSGRIAFQDNIDTISGYLFLGNYGDTLGTGGLVVKKGGNVGIGTMNPGQKLDVAGDVRGTGLCIGSDCRTSWPALSCIVAVALAGGPVSPSTVQCPAGYIVTGGACGMNNANCNLGTSFTGNGYSCTAIQEWNCVGGGCACFTQAIARCCKIQ